MTQIKSPFLQPPEYCRDCDHIGAVHDGNDSFPPQAVCFAGHDFPLKGKICEFKKRTHLIDLFGKKTPM
jgi:hypothetical protein